MIPGQPRCYAAPMNGQQLEEKITELIREYYENQDPEIPERVLDGEISSMLIRTELLLWAGREV